MYQSCLKKLFMEKPNTWSLSYDTVPLVVTGLRENEEKDQNPLSMWLVGRLIFDSLQATQIATAGPECEHVEGEDNRHQEQHSPRDEKLHFQNVLDNCRLN